MLKFSSRVLYIKQEAQLERVSVYKKYIYSRLKSNGWKKRVKGSNAITGKDILF